MNMCNDVAHDVFDGDEEWCDATGEHHVCGLPEDHICQQAHECTHCGVTW